MHIVKPVLRSHMLDWEIEFVLMGSLQLPYSSLLLSQPYTGKLSSQPEGLLSGDISLELRVKLRMGIPI